MQNKFSPSEAATSFSSFFKAHPNFVIRIMGLNAILTLVTLTGLGLGGYFETFSQWIALNQSGKIPSESKIMALLAELNWPVVIVVFLLSSAGSLMISSACLRKAVRNVEAGFYGLNWGKDESQLLIAMLQLFLLIFIAYIVAITGVTIMARLGLALVAALIGVCFVLFLVFAIGRFGIYGVLTIANNKASTFAAFNYSKEQFWSFVGAFVLNGIIVIIVSMLAQLIFGAILSPLMKDVIGKMPTSMASFFSIGSLLYFAIIGAISGALHIAAVCTGAYAFHKINEQPEQ